MLGARRHTHVPMARRIRASGVKMVLSGEGADEIFGGYLYFHKAPNGTELHEECVRKVQALHTYDCLRANKATMAHGLEVRVPFLDGAVLDATMEIEGKHKMITKGASKQHIEKWLFRAAFDTPHAPFITLIACFIALIAGASTPSSSP